MSKYFEYTTVVCVRATSSPHSPNIDVIELGGGSTRNRINALMRLARISLQVFAKRSESVIFHHMLIQPLAMFGWFYKSIKVPQVLWYSHSAKSLTLRVGSIFCDAIVTPSRDCFPIKGSKRVIEVGHGIQVALFEEEWNRSKRKRDIVVVGRISRIKNLELIVDAVSRYQDISGVRIEIDLIGPILDIAYSEYLTELSADKGVVLRFIPAQNPAMIPSLLSHYRYSYNGNPKTLDKSAVEAVLAGCFLLTEIEPALQLTGMKKVWSDMNLLNPSLLQQLSSVESLDEERVIHLRRQLFETAKRNNELTGTISRIVSVLTRVYS